MSKHHHCLVKTGVYWTSGLWTLNSFLDTSIRLPTSSTHPFLNRPQWTSSTSHFIYLKCRLYSSCYYRFYRRYVEHGVGVTNISRNSVYTNDHTDLSNQTCSIDRIRYTITLTGNSGTREPVYRPWDLLWLSTLDIIWSTDVETPWSILVEIKCWFKSCVNLQ